MNIGLRVILKRVGRYLVGTVPMHIWFIPRVL